MEAALLSIWNTKSRLPAPNVLLGSEITPAMTDPVSFAFEKGETVSAKRVVPAKVKISGTPAVPGARISARIALEKTSARVGINRTPSLEENRICGLHELNARVLLSPLACNYRGRKSFGECSIGLGPVRTGTRTKP